jgi:hypothetical protein
MKNRMMEQELKRLNSRSQESATVVSGLAIELSVTGLTQDHLN